jgi:hypothetical protein
LRVRILSAPTFDTERSASVKVGETTYGLFADAWWASFSVTTVPGSAAEAPTVQILSPLDQQEVNAQSIQVTGQASDPDGVFSIEVNGIAATSVDDFATWQARIPLETGPNVITVASADSFLNRNSTTAQIQIENLGVVLVDPKAIETDVSNLRLLVADQALGALVAVDLIDGSSSIISDLQTPDERVPLTNPHRLAVNGAGTIAWIVDSAYDDLIRIDLVTGQRSLIEDTVGTEPAESVGDAIDIAIDETSGRAVLLFRRYSDSRVVALDLLSGERTVLSDAITPDSENMLSRPRCLVMDSMNDRLLVIQDTSDPIYDNPSIIAVDPTTGQRSVVVAEGGTGNPMDAEMDLSNQRILILRSDRHIVMALDLRNDELDTLWEEMSFYWTSLPLQIAIDPYNDRALLLHSFKNMLGAIDFATGDPLIAF